MKKVGIYKRKSIKGWWVGWYESGKRNKSDKTGARLTPEAISRRNGGVE